LEVTGNDFTTCKSTILMSLSFQQPLLLDSIHKKGICRRSVSGKAVATVAGLLLSEVIVDVVPIELHAQPWFLRENNITVIVHWIANGLQIRWRGLVIEART